MVEVSLNQWDYMVDRLDALEELLKAVGDLFYHQLEEDWLSPTVEPGPQMTYDVHLRIDGGYKELWVAEAVLKDIWRVRHETVLQRLEELDYEPLREH